MLSIGYRDVIVLVLPPSCVERKESGLFSPVLFVLGNKINIKILATTIN